MVSSNPMPKIIVLVLIITFSVTLTENLQLADGLSALANKIIYEMEVGETQVQTWNVINNKDVKGWVEFYADGPGSEFLTFSKIQAFEPRQNIDMEIIVSIPKDHPDNIELRPLFFALMRGDPLDEGKTGAVVNVQLKKTLTIQIGDNPIYTAPLEESIPVIPDEIIVPEREEQREAKETLEEKMARIEADNKALLLDQMKEAGVDDKWEGTFEEDPVPDYEPEVTGYTPEPTTDPEPVADKIECDFIAWFLSLFGIGKC